jgi:hypothetical protein
MLYDALKDISLVGMQMRTWPTTIGKLEDASINCSGYITASREDGIDPNGPL